jgi:PRTRC genetic system protein A
MHFRNPKQQSFLEEQDYEEELARWNINSNVPERLAKKEPEVPQIPIETQCEYWHHFNDIQYGVFNPDVVTKPNAWVVTKHGTWLVQKNKTGYYGAKKSEVGIPTLPDTHPLPNAFFDLTYGKIPNEILDQIVAFFRDIMKKYNNAEAFVQVYWDKQEEKYVVQVPKQQVSGGSVRYDAQENLNVVDRKRYVFVYECHSHNSMNAFWSGIDNADEKELRIYGVFGELDTDDYKCLHRFFVGEKQVDVDLKLIFDIPQKEDDSKYLVSHKNKQYLVKKDQLILDEKPKYIYHTEAGEKIYVPVTDVIVYKEPTGEVEFPQDWFSNVNVPLPKRETTTRTEPLWMRKNPSSNWDGGGSGYWPEYPSSEQGSLDYTSQRYVQEGMETTEEEAQEQFEMMAQEAYQMASDVSHFTSDFEELETTFAFLEGIETSMGLKNLEKAIQNYYYRSRQISEEGPTDGRY